MTTSTPTQQAIRGLKAKGFSEERIAGLLATAVVDPDHLDRFTEKGRRIDPTFVADWALVDDETQLILRWK